MRSLQAKLGTGLILSLIVIFAALWLLISVNIQYLAEDYVASRLRHDAEMLLGKLQIDRKGKPELDESAVDPVYQQPFSGHYYLITTGEHSLASRSLWDETLTRATAGPGSQIRHYQTGPNKQSLLLISNGFVKQGHVLNITVAEDLDPIQANIKQFQLRFAITAVSLLLLLFVLQGYILRHSLKSLSRIRAELHALQKGDVRQLNTDVPTELRPLINEVNDLLGMLEQRLRRSRDALGDLAHSVKKPLTLLQQLTDQYRKSLPEELYSSLTQQTTAINQLTDRILKRARLAGQTHGGTRFSFASDLPGLLATLGQMHRDKGITVESHIPEDIACPIDREDMLELLGNILDNAYKWARQHIRLSVTATDELALHIEDDGPGADPRQFSQLNKRGVRLDETVQGYGFGLAIAADMVEEYQGTMRFSRSAQLGGLQVDIRLPLIRPHATE